jgi:hypothetical protein
VQVSRLDTLLVQRVIPPADFLKATSRAMRRMSFSARAVPRASFQRALMRESRAPAANPVTVGRQATVQRPVLPGFDRRDRNPPQLREPSAIASDGETSAAGSVITGAMLGVVLQRCWIGRRGPRLR